MNTWIFAITTFVVIISSSIGQNVGQGNGPWTGGEARATVLYKGKYYRDAVITDFHQTTVTIASRDGDGEIPVNSLPMAMKSEHAAWLKQNSSATSPAATPSLPAAPTGGGDVASWQRRAIATYPDLAKEGTSLHTRFLALVAELKKTEPAVFDAPSWPLTVADRAAQQVALDALWNNKHTVREVETDQRSFIGKPFILKGTIEVASYYNFGYGNAQGTHFAFKFHDGREGANLYMERKKAASLRKQVLDADGTLKGVFMVVIDPKRFGDASDLYLEILDYRPPTE